jgi:hypothetical protein
LADNPNAIASVAVASAELPKANEFWPCAFEFPPPTKALAPSASLFEPIALEYVPFVVVL